MNKRIRTKITVFVLGLAFMMAACGGNPSNKVISDQPEEESSLEGTVANPTEGIFKGTTDQGETIMLWVKQVDGHLMVTAVQYKIKLIADTFSVTDELMMPNERSMSILDGQFSGTHQSGDTSEEISGKFFGDEGVEGRLRCSLSHPQGLGTAVGDVTFVAYKVNP